MCLNVLVVILNTEFFKKPRSNNLLKNENVSSWNHIITIWFQETFLFLKRLLDSNGTQL